MNSRRDSANSHTARSGQTPWPGTIGANWGCGGVVKGSTARIEADADNYAAGVANLLTPRASLEVMLAKSYASMVQEAGEVTLDQGLGAAREFNRLAVNDDDEVRWARAHAQIA